MLIVQHLTMKRDILNEVNLKPRSYKLKIPYEEAVYMFSHTQTKCCYALNSIIVDINLYWAAFAHALTSEMTLQVNFVNTSELNFTNAHAMGIYRLDGSSGYKRYVLKIRHRDI